MSDNKIETIKSTLENLIKKMGFEVEIETFKESDSDGNENIICNITADEDSHLLIGQHGINLQAIQHIARLMVRNNIDEKIHFSIDINDYKKQKNESIIKQAILAAEEAIDNEKIVTMNPMSTYERRIVHMELSKNPNIATESIGNGEDRKIVIKPSKIS